MINFTHTGVKIKCKPENAAEYRRLMDKPPKAKAVSEKRDYPKWNPTMTTGGYLQKYLALNDRRRMLECGHTCANYDVVPTMYDSAAPEVLEELDPDYEYTPTIKARKITAKQAIVQALAALKVGDMDMAQCILEEALK
jgi:hypothetical protein